jgi:ArsR family transcriptional regulator, zinc-responsive transcriptional repressor
MVTCSDSFSRSVAARTNAEQNRQTGSRTGLVTNLRPRARISKNSYKLPLYGSRTGQGPAMSTKSAAALPTALREATAERFVIEAARRVHRALGDTNRLDLVRRLAQSPATVTELIESTDLSQPLVSWHLRRLRSAGLVSSERAGRESIYTLRTETIAEGHALMLAALGVANPAAWVAPEAALPNAQPLVDAVRAEEE